MMRKRRRVDQGVGPVVTPALGFSSGIGNNGEDSGFIIVLSSSESDGEDGNRGFGTKSTGALPPKVERVKEELPSPLQLRPRFAAAKSLPRSRRRQDGGVSYSNENSLEISEYTASECDDCDAASDNEPSEASTSKRVGNAKSKPISKKLPHRRARPERFTPYVLKESSSVEGGDSDIDMSRQEESLIETATPPSTPSPPPQLVSESSSDEQSENNVDLVSSTTRRRKRKIPIDAETQTPDTLRSSKNIEALDNIQNDDTFEEEEDEESQPIFKSRKRPSKATGAAPRNRKGSAAIVPVVPTYSYKGNTLDEERIPFLEDTFGDYVLECPITRDRLALRAVLTNDMALLRSLRVDAKEEDCRPYKPSPAVSLSWPIAAERWMETAPVEAVLRGHSLAWEEMLAQEQPHTAATSKEAKPPRRSVAERCSLEGVTQGSVSFQAYGAHVSSGRIGLARGGKQGNLAFTTDKFMYNPTDLLDRTFIHALLFRGVSMDRLGMLWASLLRSTIPDSWNENFARSVGIAARLGLAREALWLMNFALKAPMLGYNAMHLEVLAFGYDGSTRAEAQELFNYISSENALAQQTGTSSAEDAADTAMESALPQLTDDIEILLGRYRKPSWTKKAAGGFNITPLFLASINPKGSDLFIAMVERIGVGVAMELIDSQGWSVFHYASTNENPASLNWLIQTVNSSINVRCFRGFTPVVVATIARREKSVSTLLEAGADFLSLSGRPRKPINPTMKRAAEEDGRSDPFGFFVGFGAPHVAAYFGSSELLGLFFEHASKPAKVIGMNDKSERSSILHHLAASGNVSLMTYVLQEYCTKTALRKRDKFRRTPLIRAIMAGRTQMVNFLLERHADHQETDSSGNTCLHYAAAYGHFAIAAMLIEGAKADVNALNTWKSSAASIAMAKGHSGFVRYLVEKIPSFDPNVRDEKGTTLLHLFCQQLTKEGLNLVQSLAQRGADVNARSLDSTTPLHIIARKSLPLHEPIITEEALSSAVEVIHEQVKSFMDSEVQACEDRRNAEYLSVAVADLLLKCGADLNVETRDGSTPLRLALENGNVAFVKWALQERAEVETTSLLQPCLLTLCAAHASEPWGVPLLRELVTKVGRKKLTQLAGIPWESPVSTLWQHYVGADYHSGYGHRSKHTWENLKIKERQRHFFEFAQILVSELNANPLEVPVAAPWHLIPELKTLLIADSAASAADGIPAICSSERLVGDGTVLPRSEFDSAVAMSTSGPSDEENSQQDSDEHSESSRTTANRRAHHRKDDTSATRATRLATARRKIDELETAIILDRALATLDSSTFTATTRIFECDSLKAVTKLRPRLKTVTRGYSSWCTPSQPDICVAPTGDGKLLKNLLRYEVSSEVRLRKPSRLVFRADHYRSSPLHYLAGKQNIPEFAYWSEIVMEHAEQVRPREQSAWSLMQKHNASIPVDVRHLLGRLMKLLDGNYGDETMTSQSSSIDQANAATDSLSSWLVDVDGVTPWMQFIASNTEGPARISGLKLCAASSLHRQTVNVRKWDGSTALAVAAAVEMDIAVRLLLQSGADPFIPDLCGRRPVHFAAAKRWKKFWQLPGLNTRDLWLRTPFHYAIEAGDGNSFDYEQVLLKCYCNEVEVQSARGECRNGTPEANDLVARKQQSRKRSFRRFVLNDSGSTADTDDWNPCRNRSESDSNPADSQCLVETTIRTRRGSPTRCRILSVADALSSEQGRLAGLPHSFSIETAAVLQDGIQPTETALKKWEEGIMDVTVADPEPNPEDAAPLRENPLVCALVRMPDCNGRTALHLCFAGLKKLRSRVTVRLPASLFVWHRFPPSAGATVEDKDRYEEISSFPVALCLLRTRRLYNLTKAITGYPPLAINGIELGNVPAMCNGPVFSADDFEKLWEESTGDKPVYYKDLITAAKAALKETAKLGSSPKKSYRKDGGNLDENAIYGGIDSGVPARDKCAMILARQFGCSNRCEDLSDEYLYDFAVECIDGTDVEVTFPAEGGTSAMKANTKDPVEVVSSLSLFKDMDLNQADTSGLTPVATAASCGATISTLVLLGRKADLKSATKDGCPPLSTALMCGKTEMAVMLMREGADLNASYLRYWHSSTRDSTTLEGFVGTPPLLKSHSPYWDCCQKHLNGVLFFMLQTGFPFERAVLDAIRLCDLRVLSTILQKLPNGDAVTQPILVHSKTGATKDRGTILHVLAQAKLNFDEEATLTRRIIAQLLSYKLNVLYTDCEGQTALHRSAARRKLALVAPLLDNVPSDVRVQFIRLRDAPRGWLPFHDAFFGVLSLTETEIRETVLPVLSHLAESLETEADLSPTVAVPKTWLKLLTYLDVMTLFPEEEQKTLLKLSHWSRKKRTSEFINQFSQTPIKTTLKIATLLLRDSRTFCLLDFLETSQGMHRQLLGKTVDSFGCTPLIWAVRIGADVAKISRNFLFAVHQRDAHHRTALWHALHSIPWGTRMNVDVVQLLLGKIKDEAVVSEALSGVSQICPWVRQAIATKFPNVPLPQNQVSAAGGLWMKSKFDARISCENDTHENSASSQVPSTAQDQNMESLPEEGDTPDFFADAKEAMIGEIDSSKPVPPAVHSCMSSAADCRVVVEGNVIYEATMYKVELTASAWNNHTFYHMQLVHNFRKDLYLVLTRFGGVGDVGLHQETPAESFDHAKKEFAKIFRSKTGVDWAQRDSGKRIPKHYLYTPSKDLKRFTTSLEKLKINFHETSVGNPAPTEHGKPLTGLLSRVCDTAVFKECKNQSPFGLSVDRALQNEALRLLDAVATAVSELARYKETPGTSAALMQAANETILKLSAEYNMLIKHGDTDLAILSSESAINNERRRIKDAGEMQLAVQMVLAARHCAHRLHPTDYIMQSLRCRVEPLNPQTWEGLSLANYIDATLDYHRKSHTITNIYRIEQSVDSVQWENRKIEAVKKNFRRRLLFHGTHTANVLGVLFGGLRSAPASAAELAGAAFGDGVYFSDMLAKTIAYCRGGCDGAYYILTAEVILGKVRTSSRTSAFEEAPWRHLGADEQYGCIHVLGSKCPNWRQHTALTEDGVEFFVGHQFSSNETIEGIRGVESLVDENIASHDLDIDTDQGTSMTYPEYVIHHPAQIRLRYLIELSEKKQ